MFHPSADRRITPVIPGQACVTPCVRTGRHTTERDSTGRKFGLDRRSVVGWTQERVGMREFNREVVDYGPSEAARAGFLNTSRLLAT